MNQTWLRCGAACRTCARARHGLCDPCDPSQPSFTHRLSLNGLNSRFLAWMSAYVNPPECQCDPALWCPMATRPENPDGLRLSLACMLLRPRLRLESAAFHGRLESWWRHRL